MSEASASGGARWPAWPVLVVLATFLAATAVLLATTLSVGALDHNVGVYVCLAELARQGVVYPQTQTTELVYCTLYQPLAFLPYAILPGSGLALIASIRALVRVEVFVCLLAVVGILRRCRVPWVPALAAVALLACAFPITAAMLKCNDDPRGALMALLAFAAFAGNGARCHPWRAAPIFALAFLTKLTAPCAAGVAALVLALQRRRPAAASHLLIGCTAFTIAAYAVAHGVLGWDLLGNGLRFALVDAKPGRSFGLQIEHFVGDLVCDPVTAVLLIGGAALALARAVRARGDAIDAWLLAALVRALVEYGSHGTELNHLFEPCLLGAVVVVRAAQSWLIGWWALAAVVVAFWVGRPAVRIPRADPTPLSQSPIVVAANVLRAQLPAPTLCEDPLLAWTAGQRPLVTDPFLAGPVLDRHPQIRAAWFGAGNGPEALQRLVLMANPDAPDGRADQWYGSLHFDARFLADVRRLFEVVAPSDFGVVMRRR